MSAQSAAPGSADQLQPQRQRLAEHAAFAGFVQRHHLAHALDPGRRGLCGLQPVDHLLAQAGVTDLSGYAVDPSQPLLPDLFLD